MENTSIDYASIVNKIIAEIPKNPIERLGPVSADILKRDNFVIDAHAHMFDGGCVDVKYFILRMLSSLPRTWIVRIIDRLFKRGGKDFAASKDFSFEDFIYSEESVEFMNDQESDEDFLEFIEKVINEEILTLEDEIESRDRKDIKASEKGLWETYRRLKYIVGILRRKKMSHVLDVFEEHYAINTLMKPKPDILTVVPGMDLNRGWASGSTGRIQKSQTHQNAELRSLLSNRSILPFFPVDPRRATDPEENLYESFRNAFSGINPFYGVKVYPALGYAPADPRLDPIYEVCAKYRIPVMTHCGGTMVSTFDNPIIVNDDGQSVEVPGASRDERVDWLNHPERWARVLEKHPDLHLNLAHFGGSDQWKESDPLSTERVKVILDLMCKYNVYSDFSFNLDSPKATLNFVNALNQNSAEGELIRKRALFGTDYWVILPVSDLNEDQTFFIDETGQHFMNLVKHNTLRFLHLSQSPVS